ncbi:kinase-like protein [Laetiporus sulphureus 93-53]|uniref:Kinase-like protein n=1 Tax=Laetiporus sulphureus 93-53 TaxID=1314785 RepID=A0A165H3A2_9APHY|nr:kinase-like protein [Laetiporus sulphureus 93-53]KZT11185.1 kinase-like protein [Laetiporus sulphureus 93-53]
MAPSGHTQNQIYTAQPLATALCTSSLTTTMLFRKSSPASKASPKSPVAVEHGSNTFNSSAIYTKIKRSARALFKKLSHPRSSQTFNSITRCAENIQDIIGEESSSQNAKWQIVANSTNVASGPRISFSVGLHLWQKSNSLYTLIDTLSSRSTRLDPSIMPIRDIPSTQDGMPHFRTSTCSTRPELSIIASVATSFMSDVLPPCPQPSPALSTRSTCSDTSGDSIVIVSHEDVGICRPSSPSVMVPGALALPSSERLVSAQVNSHAAGGRPNACLQQSDVPSLELPLIPSLSSNDGTSSDGESSTTLASDEGGPSPKVSVEYVFPCPVAQPDEYVAPFEERNDYIDRDVGHDDDDLVSDDTDSLDGNEDACLDDEGQAACDLFLRNGDTTYKLLTTLGNGACGRVVLAETDDGQQVAIKVTPKLKQYRYACGRDLILHEKRVMETANNVGSRYLMQLIASWEDKKFIYFVMKAYPGSLRYRLASVALDPMEAKLLCAEMAYAVKELHDSRTIHRDIKPDNFLVDDEGHLVLGDFGYSYTPKPHYKFEKAKTFTSIGTPGYAAPDAIVSGSKGYTYTIDIFSLGLVFLEVLGGLQMPYYRAPTLQAQLDVMDAKHLELDLETVIEDAQARDLVLNMLNTDSTKRCSSSAVLCHPFFDDIDKEKLANRELSYPRKPVFYSLPKQSVKLSFSTFYGGLDSTYDDYHKDEDGRLLYNDNTARQLIIGGDDDFKFPR